VSFVDERGGLQEMVRALAAHVALGEPVELSVDERREFFEGFLLAVAPRCQKLSKLVSPGRVHGPEIYHIFSVQPLCSLCLCVSVVRYFLGKITTEAQRTQRFHREEHN